MRIRGQREAAAAFYAEGPVLHTEGVAAGTSGVAAGTSGALRAHWNRVENDPMIFWVGLNFRAVGGEALSALVSQEG